MDTAYQSLLTDDLTVQGPISETMDQLFLHLVADSRSSPSFSVCVPSLQQQAKKVQQDPVHNAHAKRMREHPFYSDYFIPRVVSFSRAMGWPIVSTPAFEVPGDTSKASILWQQVGRDHWSPS